VLVFPTVICQAVSAITLPLRSELYDLLLLVISDYRHYFFVVADTMEEIENFKLENLVSAASCGTWDDKGKGERERGRKRVSFARGY
jgi:hypothetical protein